MKTALLVLTVLGLLLTLAKGVDTILFEPSQTSNVTYRVRWGTASGRVDGTIDIGTNTAVTLANGPWGPLYYSVVSLTTNGLMSYPSAEVPGTNRPYAPTQVRIISSP